MRPPRVGLSAPLSSRDSGFDLDVKARRLDTLERLGHFAGEGWEINLHLQSSNRILRIDCTLVDVGIGSRPLGIDTCAN
jgi:hypothetical protein